MVENAPITSPQLRAARALLDWSQEELAAKAGVSLSTVRDYEKERRGGEIEGLKLICRALDNYGVIFLQSEGDLGPGVRLRLHLPNVLRWPTKRGKWEELAIPVEWRGREYVVLIPQTVLDDFGHFRGTPPDHEYLRIFEERRGAILRAAATAIDAGRITADQRVSLTHKDFPDSEFR
jgi:transcriptional regulator with XRE-family HTH domain